MKIGLFSDSHITRNMIGMEDMWHESILKSFEYMYKVFKDYGVDFVINCGDFLDKNYVNSKDLTFIMGVLNKIDIETYFLVGNHESSSEVDHIIRIANYNPLIKVVGDFYEIHKDNETFTFLPYYIDIEEFLKNHDIKDHIVLTHHDIFGSPLAGGKVSSSFGVNPGLFDDAKIVFNGHIHSRSILGKVHNIGSMFSLQFGEIDEGNINDKPKFYVYDMDNVKEFDNPYSPLYITCNVKKLDDYLYNIRHNCDEGNNVILRISYENDKDIDSIDMEEKLFDYDNVKKVLYKKIIDNSSDINIQDVIDETSKTNIDIKEVIRTIIYMDKDIEPEDKELYIDACINMLVKR